MLRSFEVPLCALGIVLTDAWSAPFSFAGKLEKIDVLPSGGDALIQFEQRLQEV